ncbi:hypothetical protein QF035_002539 [Streptomyces umbrinus]|uniref:Transposase n=1 Tax=Streptomyces umbrinus TaxID=67370 RepID=A0ABU0SNA2_9ACTN|nr:hypothetical protein [Streptomyces umbrinus]
MPGYESAHARRREWVRLRAHETVRKTRPALSRSRVVLRYVKYRTDQHPRRLRHQATTSKSASG